MKFIKINIMILKNIKKKIINYMHIKYIIYFNYLNCKKTKKINFYTFYIKKTVFLIHHKSTQKHQINEVIKKLSLLQSHSRINSYSFTHINIILLN